MKPNTTFKMFIQEPDLGACFNQEGNNAKSVNGRANANAKPNIPNAGANQLPLVAVSTSSNPTIGAVHENDTSTNVKAMRKMLNRPLVCEAFESTAFAQRSGSLISNQPKNDRANTTKRMNRKILNTAFVDIAFKVSLPKRAVTNKPSTK